MEQEEIHKKINKFKAEIQEGFKKLTPQINGVMEHIKNATVNMQPKLMKESKINGKRAKVILYNDNAIRIEFTDAQEGVKFYEKCQ